ncbi:MAG: hypothetical protein WC829_04460 [Hyphomicrobium sp.]|jgi:hypothetical protein
MSFQIRVTAPAEVSGTAISREIARQLENAALDLLRGVGPEKYAAAVERYQVLHELMTFMEERSDALEKGDPLDEA